jgi:predicted protein tyrosine phosphatase
MHCPIHNPYQRQQTFQRLLFVCSAGLLRSPTAAFVAANRGYNTRAAGMEDYALIPVTQQLADWADRVFCMDEYQAKILKEQFDVEAVVLHIPDKYEYRNTKLIKLINEEFDVLKL